MGLGWLVSEVLVDLDGLIRWPTNNKAIRRIRLVMAYPAIVMRDVQQSVPRWKMVFELFPQVRSTLLAVFQSRWNTPADEVSVAQGLPLRIVEEYTRHQKKRSHQIADVNPFQRRKSLETIGTHLPRALYMVLLPLIFVSNLTVGWSATGSLNKMRGGSGSHRRHELLF